MLWFLFISIILHFIGDIPFLLQFNTLLTLELRPRGDPDTSLKNVKWQSTRRTLQQHNGIFFVFLATLEAVKLALDKNSKRVCVQWNSIECGYICSTVLKNWSTVQFTSLWKLRKNSRIIAKMGRSDILHRDFILMKYKILTLSKTKTREITRWIRNYFVSVMFDVNLRTKWQEIYNRLFCSP